MEIIEVSSGTSLASEYWTAPDPTLNGYIRAYTFINTDPSILADPTVEIVVNRSLLNTGELPTQAISVGGIMLELASPAVRGAMPYTSGELASEASNMGSTCGTSGTDVCTAADVPDTFAVFNPLRHPPRPYVHTLDEPTIQGPYCEDTDGVAYRSDKWQRVCRPECLRFAGSCGPSHPGYSLQCYWETSFEVSYDTLANGSVLGATGFATGNYNYRWDTVAVNFVGTGLYDCGGEVVDSSTCYGRGYIPYSLEHTGPFPVLDRHGSATAYDAPLFTGRIVNGRGLAAERYLTNPVSSADRGLIESYSHPELRGRPIAGSYRLRVREVPGLRFHEIEDVQLLFGYRYWTRLD